MNRSTIVAAALAATTLAAPAAAMGHVTLQPDKAAAGGFTRLDVRVPNEQDDAGTRKVEVQMPPGFIFVSTEPVAGWTAKTTTRKIDKPIDSHGEKITEEVATVTFTGRGEDGVIRPGEFRDFGLSVGVPEGRPGSKLTFKSLQTYQGGEVVRWIGAPDSEEPAPQVTLTAAEEDGGGAADKDTTTDAGTPVADTGAGTPAPAEASGGDGDDGDGLAIAALVVGGLGLAAGGAGLATARKARAV